MSRASGDDASADSARHTETSTFQQNNTEVTDSMDQDHNDRTTLRCGVVIDGTGAPAAEDVAIVIEGGRIASVTPWSAAGTTGTVRDLSDFTVVPGLIDGHTHLCNLADGDPTRTREIDDVECVVAGLASAQAALCTGLTTVADMGSPRGLAIRVGELIRAGWARGPHVAAAGGAITTTAGHGSEIGSRADTAAEVVHAVREQVAHGAEVIKMMVTGGATDRTPTNRRRAQYSVEELAAGIDDAHRLGKRVVGHANATEGISRAVTAGIDVIAHCNWLGLEDGEIDIDLDTVAAMKDRDVRIDLNIEGAMRNMLATDGRVARWPYDGPAPTTRWDLLAPIRASGVRLYVTSDAFGPAIGSFTESVATLGARWSVPAEELISLVTSEPADALGLTDGCGTMAPGAVADLLVLRGDLRNDYRALLDPAEVMQAGRTVVADGRLVPSAMASDVDRFAAGQQQLLDDVFGDLS